MASSTTQKRRYREGATAVYQSGPNCRNSMDKSEVQRIALMSIHPEFADALFEGRKGVEFRRVAPRADISHIVVSSTKPTGAVIGVLEVERVERKSPQRLW